MKKSKIIVSLVLALGLFLFSETSFCGSAQKNSNLSKNNLIFKGGVKVVGLDNYYNNEWKKNNDGKEVRFHYIWEDTANSGFSKLGNIIKGLGAEITELHEAPTMKDLSKFSIYFIVDPDTTTENPHPNYIEKDAIKNIVQWVKEGGVLVLFANDKGNCEFTHLNNLSENFGIHFNYVSLNRVQDDKYYQGKFDHLPNHPIFKGVSEIYMKEISTLKLQKPASSILTDKGNVIIASSKVGKGFVFAVGDPWIYNEYIDNHKLPKEYENYKAAQNLFKWLLDKSMKVKSK